jgi:hypothetical protein
MLKFTKKKREIAETETISSKKNYISGFLWTLTICVFAMC